MIRRTLNATKAATFSIDLPAPGNGMPTPTGTGFFVSPDGWFVTAAHVVSQTETGTPRNDIDKAFLTQRGVQLHGGSALCQFAELVFMDPVLDFALVKVDFEKNSSKDWLKELTEFPYLTVSTRALDDGEPVYAFGYPLPNAAILHSSDRMTVGSSTYRPRVTSAVVAASRYEYGMVVSGGDTREYVLDKALNYGNSGGPIVATETGCVHAFCSRFQPVGIPQSHLGINVAVVVPSLYGVATSLSNPRILRELQIRGIATSGD